MKVRYFEVTWDEKCQTVYVKALDQSIVEPQMTILYGTLSKPFTITELNGCKEAWIDHDFTQINN